MSTVQDALNITRTLLNDDAGLQWHDPTLMPKMVLAWNELVAKLVLNGVPALYNTTSPWIDIPAGQLNLGADQPTNLQVPIKMYELQPDDVVSNNIPMTKKDFLPNLQQDSTLRFWAWIQQTIQFIGSTCDRWVQLDYLGNVPTPVATTDTLFFNLSETYLGPRVAAMVMSGTPQGQDFQKTAEVNLSMLVRTEVKNSQNLPVRRKPFSYTIKRRGRLWL
jgi:hypothetical protein